MLDWLESVLGFFGDIGKRILDALRTTLRTLIGWVGDGFAWLNQAVDDIYKWVISIGWDAYYTARDALARLVQFYGWFVNEAWSTIRGWVDDAVKALTGYIRRVEEWAHGITDWLVDRVQGVFDFVTSTVPGWIEDRAQQVIGLLVDYVRRVEGWAHSVTDWILARLEDLPGQVWHWAWDHLPDMVTETIEVVHRAWNWLVYFALHPFAWFTDLLQGVITRLTRNMVGWIIHAIETEGDSVDEKMSQWLAS